jgi:hypothetical protein
MVQVAWSALGLLAAAVLAMFGMFFYLGARIDAQGQSLGARIDALGARLDSRLDAIEARLDAHIERHWG